jgi:hypothetical protein
MPARTPRLAAECLRRHPISECSASIPLRRRRPGSAPSPPAPALRRLGLVLHRPAPPRYPSRPSSSYPLLHQPPLWPHSESLGPGCTTTWPAVRRLVALHSSIGVAFRADGCLPSGGRARSESVSASCAMVGWALSIGLIDLPFSHWTHVTFKQVHPSFDVLHESFWSRFEVVDDAWHTSVRNFAKRSTDFQINKPSI